MENTQERGQNTISPAESNMQHADHDMPNTASESAKSNGLFKVIIFLIVVAVVAVAGYFGFQQYQESQVKPADVLKESVKKTLMAKTSDVSVDSSVIMTTKVDGKDQKITIEAKLDGQSDGKDLANYTDDVSKGSVDYNVKLDPPMEPEPGFKLDTLNLKADYVMNGGALFVNFKQVPDIGPLKLSYFIKDWYKLDLNQLAKNSGSQDEKMVKYAEMMKKVLNAENLKKMEDAFDKSNPFKDIVVLPKEKVNNRNCYHYKFKIDTIEAKNLGFDMADVIVNDPNVKKELAVNEEEFQKGLAEFRKAKDNKDVDSNLIKADKYLPVFEVWIDKNTKELMKLSLTDEVDSNQVSKDFNLSANDVPPDLKMSLKEVMIVKSYGNPVTVEEPKTYNNFEDILKGLSNM
jgi:hypothetical protein